MSLKPEQLSAEQRRALRSQLVAADDGLICGIPKVELHIHVEGTLTPELRWKLGQRHGQPVRFGEDGKEVTSLEGLTTAYNNVISRAQLGSLPNAGDGYVTFFQAYYSGFLLLKNKEDFFDLAYNYFQRAAAMNVRYCEPFFDPQGHTSRGVSWDTMMGGFREAQQKARAELNAESKWIMCFLRDQSPESAMEHYIAAQPYRDMIVGIGLDSKEDGRPPSLFNVVYALARRDGFKLTAHCDVGVPDTHRHIRQVASALAGSGLDRMDHGLNVADDPELVALMLDQKLLMTICPWAYLRRETYDDIANNLRLLVDAGVSLCIASDGPPYMDNAWITHNLLLARDMCKLTDEEVVKIVRDSVRMSWADEKTKDQVDNEITEFLLRRAESEGGS